MAPKKSKTIGPAKEVQKHKYPTGKDPDAAAASTSASKKSEARPASSENDIKALNQAHKFLVLVNLCYRACSAIQSDVKSTKETFGTSLEVPLVRPWDETFFKDVSSRIETMIFNTNCQPLVQELNERVQKSKRQDMNARCEQEVDKIWDVVDDVLHAEQDYEAESTVDE